MSGRIRTYARNVLIAVDVLVSALTGGDGDGTVSLRIARAARAGSRPAQLACHALAIVAPDHCGRVLADDEGREQDAQAVTR